MGVDKSRRGVRRHAGRAVRAAATVLLLSALSATALPQQDSSSTSSSARSSSTATRTSSALPSNFTLPDTSPSGGGQNTSNIPQTPLGPQIPALPDYVVNYAPIVYLDQNESYWPSSLDVHVSHTQAWDGYSPYQNSPEPLTLQNMNFTTSTSFYLSVDDPAVQPRPDWYYSTYGKPDASGYSGGNTTIVLMNKTRSLGEGVVDAFYFLFYSFNDGNNVGGQLYGNHISDIEYIMIRFYSGEPRYIFLSQHEDGEAYEWGAMQKEGDRPITYSAIGGHANYPVAGTFELIPGLIGLLQDETSAGTRWDVMKNYNAYWGSPPNNFVPTNGSTQSTWGSAPDSAYLQQTGKWGNAALQPDNPNQQIIFGQYAWSDGATGPIDPSKSLLRTWLCVNSPCTANSSLPASSKLQAGQLSAQSGSVPAVQASIFLALVAMASVLALL